MRDWEGFGKVKGEVWTKVAEEQCISHYTIHKFCASGTVFLGSMWAPASHWCGKSYHHFSRSIFSSVVHRSAPRRSRTPEQNTLLDCDTN